MKLPLWISRISPLGRNLRHYRRDQCIGDLIAGMVVAIMLVPQAMAYAMLAGLPPEVGLYASIVPLILYSLFGTSNSLAVGPVAMVSLLVVSGVGELATPGSPEFIQLCLTLALMIGVVQILMATFRLGFLVNFISHPVLVGFTSAAAIVIAVSQLKHLFGISVERADQPIQAIFKTVSQIGHSNSATLVIGVASCLVLTLFSFGIGRWLVQWGIKENVALTIAKIGPLVVVTLTALIVYLGNLHLSNSVAIVGDIPSGLPPLTIPRVDLDSVSSLVPLTFVITIVGYLESISVAKALASRRREKIDANRELFALGMADVGAAFTGGYPVTGGFSRSLVNFSAGVCTPVGSIVTAVLVAISVLFLTPAFYYVPKSVLAAIIVIAVVRLIDFKTPLHLWRCCRPDAVALLVTFVAVLGWGIEKGIFAGIASTILLLIWKMSRPHIALVGRVGESEHFENLRRPDTHATEGVLALRIDESLNFANAPYLETYLMDRVAENEETTSVLLVSSGINEIDSTGIDVLETIQQELNSLGIGFYLSNVKGPVRDRLERSGFDPVFLKDCVFPTAHLAMRSIHQQTASIDRLPAERESNSLEKQPT